MEPVFFVLAIMGCGDGVTDCAQARIEPAHYATIQPVSYTHLTLPTKA